MKKNLRDIQTPGEFVDFYILSTIAHRPDSETIKTLVLKTLPRLAWDNQEAPFSYEQLVQAADHKLSIPTVVSALNEIGITVPSDDVVVAFRDHDVLNYFCAVYIRDALQTSDGIPSCMTTPLNPDYIPWVSDLLHEHRFAKALCTDDSNSFIVTWMKSRCKSVHDDNIVARAVANCVTILKYARRDRLSVDFSRLDLSLANFHHTDLMDSVFNGAIITRQCFEPPVSSHSEPRIRFDIGTYTGNMDDNKSAYLPWMQAYLTRLVSTLDTGCIYIVETAYENWKLFHLLETTISQRKGGCYISAAGLIERMVDSLRDVDPLSIPEELKTT